MVLASTLNIAVPAGAGSRGTSTINILDEIINDPKWEGVYKYYDRVRLREVTVSMTIDSLTPYSLVPNTTILHPFYPATFTTRWDAQTFVGTNVPDNVPNMLRELFGAKSVRVSTEYLNFVHTHSCTSTGISRHWMNVNTANGELAA